MEHVEQARIVVVYRAGAVVTQKVVELSQRFRYVSVTTSVNDVESLVGMRVKEPNPVFALRRADRFCSLDKRREKKKQQKTQTGTGNKGSHYLQSAAHELDVSPIQPDAKRHRLINDWSSNTYHRTGRIANQCIGEIPHAAEPAGVRASANHQNIGGRLAGRIEQRLFNLSDCDAHRSI